MPLMQKTRRYRRPAKRAKSFAESSLVGELQVCQITDLSHDGRGVGRLQGKTCFVDGALPGETVELRLWRSHRNYDEARLSKVLLPTKDRVEPPCRHFLQCGGCSLQHLHPERQIEHKADQLAANFQRHGIRPKKFLPTLTAESLGYRRRVRLAVQRSRGGTWQLGFRNMGSRRLEPVSECLTMLPALAIWLPLLPDWLADCCAQFKIEQIELVAADDGMAIAIEGNRKPTAREVTHMLSALTALSSRLAATLGTFLAPQLWWKKLPDRAFTCLDTTAEPLWSKITAELATAVEPGQFMQVNSDINRQMIAQVLSLIKPSPGGVAVDLYCGAGNFSLPLAEHFERVIGVEGLPSLVEHGRRNARHNGLTNIDFLVTDLARLTGLSGCAGGIQLVLLDPPRAGAANIMPWVVDCGAQQVIYVSCHPSTLVRDAQILNAAGFSLEALGAMDMFPQTAHVEALALFERPGDINEAR